MLPRTIAIDFDGTLVENKWPEIGAPIWPVINSAKAEQAAGSKLILWTCREGWRLDAAVKACAGWGLHFDAVNANLPERTAEYGNDCRKVDATEYWDDRAVHHAHWIPLPALDLCECSRCGRRELHYYECEESEPPELAFPYCHCGAKMDEEVQSDDNQ